MCGVSYSMCDVIAVCKEPLCLDIYVSMNSTSCKLSFAIQFNGL